MMLKLRKNLVSLALVATLFAGCQTAQKNNVAGYGVTDEDLNASYYGEGEMAGRGVAGAGDPVFKELFSAFRGSAVRAAFKAGDRDISKEFITFANRNQMRIEEVQVLKDAKFAAAERDWKAAGSKIEERPKRGIADRLNEQDLNGLGAVQQAKIAKAFMDEKNLKDMPGLTGIYSKVDAQVKALAKVDPKAKALSGEMQTKLLTEQTARSNINEKIASNVEFAKLDKQVDDLIDRMAKQDPKFNESAERVRAKKILLQARTDNAKIYRYSDGTLKNFTVNTCDNLTMDGLERYGELLGDIRSKLDDLAEAKGMGRNEVKRLPCGNIPEITAWVAAKFQERLGRTGLSAFGAVEEMSLCNFLDAKTVPASRSLAAKNKGVVGDDIRCE